MFKEILAKNSGTQSTPGSRLHQVIFCLSAAAGAGKSAAAHSVAERAKHVIASAFFVTRGSADRRSLSRILGTLIWELAG